jgi:hypothetical protein
LYRRNFLRLGNESLARETGAISEKPMGLNPMPHHATEAAFMPEKTER